MPPLEEDPDEEGDHFRVIATDVSRLMPLQMTFEDAVLNREVRNWTGAMEVSRQEVVRLDDKNGSARFNVASQSKKRGSLRGEYSPAKERRRLCVDVRELGGRLQLSVCGSPRRLVQAHWWVFSRSEGRIAARQAAATSPETHSTEDSGLSTGE